MEKLNDEHNLIAKFRTFGPDGMEGEGVIVIACCITPRVDHHTILYDNLNRIKTVQKRFGNAPMVIFGDFNIPTKEFEEHV